MKKSTAKRYIEHALLLRLPKSNITHVLCVAVIHLWLSWRVIPRGYQDWPTILQEDSWVQPGEICVYHTIANSLTEL